MRTKQEQAAWKNIHFIDALRVTPAYDNSTDSEGDA